MSGRLASKIKPLGDYGVDYTAPLGKFTASSAVIKAKDSPTNISVLAVNDGANGGEIILTNSFVNDSSAIKMDINEVQRNLSSRTKMEIERIPLVANSTENTYVSRYAILSDGTNTVVPNDLGFASGRFVVARTLNGSLDEILLWSGIDGKFYKVENVGTGPTLLPTSNYMSVTDLANDVTDNDIDISIAKIGSTYVISWLGWHAYAANVWNGGVTAIKSAVQTNPQNRSTKTKELTLVNGPGFMNIYVTVNGSLSINKWNTASTIGPPDSIQEYSLKYDLDDLIIVNDYADNDFTILAAANNRKNILSMKESDILNNIIQVTEIETPTTEDNEKIINFFSSAGNPWTGDTVVYTDRILVTNTTLYSTLSFVLDENIIEPWVTIKNTTDIKSTHTGASNLYGNRGVYVSVGINFIEDVDPFVIEQEFFQVLGYLENNNNFYDVNTVSFIDNCAVLHQEFVDDIITVKGLLFGQSDNIIIVGGAKIEITLMGIEQTIV